MGGSQGPCENPLRICLVNVTIACSTPVFLLLFHAVVLGKTLGSICAKVNVHSFSGA